jgi:Ni/Co efflux regulator RcnB
MLKGTPYRRAFFVAALHEYASPALIGSSSRNASGENVSAPLPHPVLNTLKSLLLTSSLLLSMTACAMEKKEFDTGKWIAEGAKDFESTQRWAMSEDVERHIKPGMTRSEVRKLLGNPDSEDEFGEKVIESYYLGFPPLGIDHSEYQLFYKDDILERSILTRG